MKKLFFTLLLFFPLISYCQTASKAEFKRQFLTTPIQKESNPEMVKAARGFKMGFSLIILSVLTGATAGLVSSQNSDVAIGLGIGSGALLITGSIFNIEASNHLQKSVE